MTSYIKSITGDDYVLKLTLKGHYSYIFQVKRLRISDLEREFKALHKLFMIVFLLYHFFEFGQSYSWPSHKGLYCTIRIHQKILAFWASNDKVFSLTSHSCRIFHLKLTKSIPQVLTFGTLAGLPPFFTKVFYGAR